MRAIEETAVDFGARVIVLYCPGRSFGNPPACLKTDRRIAVLFLIGRQSAVDPITFVSFHSSDIQVPQVQLVELLKQVPKARTTSRFITRAAPATMPGMADMAAMPAMPAMPAMLAMLLRCCANACNAWYAWYG